MSDTYVQNFTFARADPNLPISIDTRNACVAREAVGAGADIVNDVSAGRHDPDMFRTVADLGVPLVLMHMRGTPETMRSLTSYDESRGGVVSEVSREIEERCKAAEAAGIHRWLQIVDPGIGFAKTLPQNVQLLKRLDHLRSTTGNLPILLGTSRKGFIGSLTGVAEPSDRDPGTIASVVVSLCLDPTPNACNIVRVHNVAACKQAMQVMDAIRRGK
jgi:2-amino-4-hydroxy-6-hydroxymethyldihydropteridine diphosphokinase / dihydropteroate synthase